MSTNIIAEMLRHYELKSDYDRKNSLKEILQEIILCGLSKGGFFNHAAFLTTRLSTAAQPCGYFTGLTDFLRTWTSH